MRRPRGVVAVGFALAWLVVGPGCFQHDRWTTESAIPRVESAKSDHPADRRVQLHTRLIEQPHGQQYLNDGLWVDAVDPLPPELSARLAANGIRVGVVSGQVPDDLEDLARTAAVSPMLRSVAVDQPKFIPVNGPIETVTIVTRTDVGETSSFDLKRAECAVVVTASPAPDGRVRLKCKPLVQHGVRRPFFQPTDDTTGFAREDRRPTEEFASLCWEITLARSDVMIVGSTAEPTDDALGPAFFVLRGSERWRQRVLTIQAHMDSLLRPPSRGSTAALVR